MDRPEAIQNILDSELESLKNDSNENKVTHGGARKGAGRPVGVMNEKTISLMAAKKKFQERVGKVADKLFNAQYSKALGEQMLMKIYYTGSGKDRKKYVERVEDEETIIAYLNEELNQTDDEEYYYMTIKPANTLAIDSLLNRSFGKATEKIEIEGGFFKVEKMIIEVVGENQDDRSIVSSDSDPITIEPQTTIDAESSERPADS